MSPMAMRATRCSGDWGLGPFRPHTESRATGIALPHKLIDALQARCEPDCWTQHEFRRDADAGRNRGRRTLEGGFVVSGGPFNRNLYATTYFILRRWDQTTQHSC